MSFMITAAVKGKGNRVKVADAGIKSIIQTSLKKKSSTNSITWLLLGGKHFMPSEPLSILDYLTASSKGIPKRSVLNLAEIIDVPMKDMAVLLNVSSKTLSRKKDTDILDSLSSSLSIEIANTIAMGLSVFEDTSKLNRWLQKENRALQGKRPFDILNTPTGIKMVNRLLGRIEEGVYT
jgi:putative toxin-antitoxin system antitoxin component (TIGR02293 family)